MSKTNGTNSKDLGLIVPAGSAPLNKLSEDMLSYALHYKNILDSVKTGIMYVDTSDRILFMNLYFCRLFNFTQRGIAGRKATTSLLSGNVDDKKLFHQKEESVLTVRWKGNLSMSRELRINVQPVWTIENAICGHLILQQKLI